MNMEYKPLTFSELYNKSCFSEMGRFEVLIKHSDEIAYSLNGKPHKINPEVQVFPKTLHPDHYQMMLQHVKNHDKLVKLMEKYNHEQTESK